MYAEIKAALDSLKIISDLLHASKHLRNFNELAAAVSEVNTKLTSATTVALASQEKQAALAERVRQLEEELVQYKNFEADSKDHTLQEIGTGVFVYVYKPVIQTTKPQHWACAKCFENCQRFTLQYWKGYFYKCHNCGTSIEAARDGHFVSINDAYEAAQ